MVKKKDFKRNSSIENFSHLQSLLNLLTIRTAPFINTLFFPIDFYKFISRIFAYFSSILELVNTSVLYVIYIKMSI